jgi:hypothetical protein
MAFRHPLSSPSNCFARHFSYRAPLLSQISRPSRAKSAPILPGLALPGSSLRSRTSSPRSTFLFVAAVVRDDARRQIVEPGHFVRAFALVLQCTE